MDGLLVVNKPAGLTSHDVVARVRRVLRERRIGHTGTLDPMATGVLPLVIGRATRLARFLTASEKTYEATIRFGFATDSGDATGRPIGEPLVGNLPDREAIERALDQFRGTFSQQPPAFSAKKIDGTRSYKLARQHRAGRVDRPGRAGRVQDDASEEQAETPGSWDVIVPPGLPGPPARPAPFVPPALPGLHALPGLPGLPAQPAPPGMADPPALPAPVEVTAHAIEILSQAGDTVTVRVRCSAGFYIRSLAHDLGERLGVGGHLAALCRTASGNLTLAQAVALTVLERGPDGVDVARQAIVPMAEMLPAFRGCALTPDGLRRALHGQDLAATDFVDHDGISGAGVSGEGPAASGFCRLVGPDGSLVGVAEPSAKPGLLHPAVVLV